MPADLVVRMRSIAEEPSNTIVDLGFSHDKASGIGGGRGFVVAGEGRKISGRAGTTAGLGGGGGWRGEEQEW